MIYKRLNRIGMIGDIKTNGGGEIAEVYGGIGESDPIYYKQREMVGTSPMQFKALGLPLKDYRIYGETLQDGTPSPDMPVDVVGCGVWDEIRQSYKLPLTVSGTESPIYLGEAQTTRRIKKLVLTGEEDISYQPKFSRFFFVRTDAYYTGTVRTTPCNCSHYQSIHDGRAVEDVPNESIYVSTANYITTFNIKTIDFTDVTDFKSFLAAQYANGTPVIVWYILAESETAVVNEPLMKIGDYADTISFAQAGVTIPTVSGTNTLTVDTTVKPSEIDLTGRIKTSG